MTTTISSFVAFASNISDLSTLKAFAQSRGLNESDVHQGTIIEATTYLKNNPSPDVLLVEIPSQEHAATLLDGLAEVCDADTKVITIGAINEYSFYCWLMDIGIAQYLLCPLTEPALTGVFDKLTSTLAGEQKDKPPSVLVAVMGARGGVGATSVAINLAAILAEHTHKKVALVDLDPQEGSVALALDMQPSVGLRDALEKPDRIDSLFLERVMNKLGKHLSVLSAEESLAEQLAVNEQAAAPLLAELRNKYDYVVLDVPRHMNGFTKTCLQTADHTLLVTELSLLSLRDTLRMQDAMQGGWKAKPPTIIANRVGLASKVEVPVVDFEKGVGAKISQQIPFVPEVFMPMTRDIPAIKHKANPAVRPLYQLAATIAPELKSKPEPAAKPKSPFSFLAKKE